MSAEEAADRIVRKLEELGKLTGELR
jgi:hypothetical protein